ncbi:MAG: NAD(P)H-dependent glycerol-3-phosphate dehydrogenase [Cytophagales bacterium]|nr:NAD(P)H-dependent glycerol-3-phosphate dehydrogenase [Cytophagales bacterium]
MADYFYTTSRKYSTTKKLSVEIAVIGGGSWATALVKILSEKEVKVKWWLRNRESVNFIKKFGHNPNYLSDIQVNLKKVKPDTNLQKVLENVSVVILAVPSAFLKPVLNEISPNGLEGKLVISAIKGMVPGDNCLITDYIHRKFHVPVDNLGIIAGPCHSEEIAMERYSYLTLGCENSIQAEIMADLLRCRFVKTQSATDLYGIEYSAIMKNIIAVAAGIANGLNYGDNFRAVLIANAMQEIKRFLDTIYPVDRDLNHSAYLGDVLVTAYSQFSRNRTFGNMIGRGYSVKSAQMEMNMIAEGYYAVQSIYEINKKWKVEMPIVHAVYNILYEKISPSVEFEILKAKLN